jgi:hypothetical protein
MTAFDDSLKDDFAHFDETFEKLKTHFKPNDK